MGITIQEFLKSFDHLPASEKHEVASEIIRRIFTLDRNQHDEVQLTPLCAECVDDDRQLAEEGIEDYLRGLVEEDAR